MCFNCYADVKAYNPHHPRGRKFTEKELIGHRDKCYARHTPNSNKNDEDTSGFDNVERLFPPNEKKH